MPRLISFSLKTSSAAATRGDVESPSPFTPLGAKGLGEGGGGGLHAVAAAIQDALDRAGGGIVHDSFNNTERIYRLLHEPEGSRSLVRVTGA